MNNFLPKVLDRNPQKEELFQGEPSRWISFAAGNKEFNFGRFRWRQSALWPGD
jgi:hypothetical protein